MGTRSQTLLLNIRSASHDDDLVVILVRSDLDHQRGIDDPDAVRIRRFHFVQPISLALNHCGMDDPVQFCPGLRITENDFSKNIPIDRSIRRQDVFTKGLNRGCIDRLAGPKEFVGDPVRVEEMASELDEHYSHGGLARSDSAGEPCAEHQMARRKRAAFSVFLMSVAIVIGPTPPGTGVIIEATSLTPRSSTSPAQM